MPTAGIALDWNDWPREPGADAAIGFPNDPVAPAIELPDWLAYEKDEEDAAGAWRSNELPREALDPAVPIVLLMLSEANGSLIDAALGAAA